jgi:hypothetical protein
MENEDKIEKMKDFKERKYSDRELKDKDKQSRYENWSEVTKNDFKEFKRSRSNPGLWKDNHGNFRRSPSKSPKTPKRSSVQNDSEEEIRKTEEYNMERLTIVQKK